MQVQQRDIFSNMPKHNHLGLLGIGGDIKNVPKFLGLSNADMSKAANISENSVRLDERIPEGLKNWLLEIAVTCELVAGFFDGDTEKTALWFKLENPALGNISPRDMIRYGRFEKLKKYIFNQINGQIP